MNTVPISEIDDATLGAWVRHQLDAGKSLSEQNDIAMEHLAAISLANANHEKGRDQAKYLLGFPGCTWEVEIRQLPNGEGITQLSRLSMFQAAHMLQSAPMAMSVDADFEKHTWTFQVAPGTPILNGVYALVQLSQDLPTEQPH